METHIDAEWANHIMTHANRSMKRMLSKESHITWHGKGSGLMMCCTLAAAILATSPKQTLRGLKQFMSWKPIDRAEQLEDELLTYDQALTDLADEGHQITPIMQICALEAMTERIRCQDKHTHDLTQRWANLSRIEDLEEKLQQQLSAIWTTIREYPISENQSQRAASSFGFQGRQPMSPLNHDGTQKVRFSMRETGICVREARGEVCGMLHLDFAAVKECTDLDYVTGADHRCSNVWKCHSKHPKDRKTRALKATKVAGNMLRSIDVDKFQSGQPAVAGDSSDDSSVAPCSALWEVSRSELTADRRSDLATFEEDFYDAAPLPDDIDDDTQQPTLSTQYPAGTSVIQHSVPSTQQPTPSTQQPTLSTQYPALGDQHPAPSTQHSVTNQSLPGCDLLIAGNSNEDGQAPVASASVVDSQNSARPGAGAGTGSGLHCPHAVNETCQPCVAPALRASSRPNFGIPAKLYIDEADYADRILEDVPAGEFAAAVLEPVDDAEIRGSNSGSNTDVTDQTYSGGSASVSDGYNTDGIIM